MSAGVRFEVWWPLGRGYHSDDGAVARMISCSLPEWSISLGSKDNFGIGTYRAYVPAAEASLKVSFVSNLNTPQPSTATGIPIPPLFLLTHSCMSLVKKKSRTAISWPLVTIPENETEEQRRARLSQEAQAKRVSDKIDNQLEAERQQKTKYAGPKILLLGAYYPEPNTSMSHESIICWLWSSICYRPSRIREINRFKEFPAAFCAKSLRKGGKCIHIYLILILIKGWRFIGWAMATRNPSKPSPIRQFHRELRAITPFKYSRFLCESPAKIIF